MGDIYSFSGPEGLKDTKHPIVFIHGTGMDHTVWTLPIRYFCLLYTSDAADE